MNKRRSHYSPAKGWIKLILASAFLVLVTACGGGANSTNTESANTGDAAVSGTIDFADSVILSNIEKAVILLEDTSVADASSVEMAKVEVIPQGTIPIRFSILYESGLIDQARHYSISVRVYETNRADPLQASYYTTVNYPVLTNGFGQNVNVIVSR